MAYPNFGLSVRVKRIIFDSIFSFLIDRRTIDELKFWCFSELSYVNFWMFRQTNSAEIVLICQTCASLMDFTAQNIPDCKLKWKIGLFLSSICTSLLCCNLDEDLKGFVFLLYKAFKKICCSIGYNRPINLKRSLDFVQLFGADDTRNLMRAAKF
jgi:hypothetical protein